VPRRYVAASPSFETLFDYEAKTSRVREIEARMGEPDFWNVQERAQATVGELKGLTAIVKPIKDLEQSLADLDTMLEMAEEDPAFAAEVPSEPRRADPVPPRPDV